MTSTRIGKLKLGVTVAFLAGVVVYLFPISLAQEATAAQQPQAAQPPALKFSHEQHLKSSITCIECHKAESEGSAVLKRPYHDSCTACHQQWFDQAAPKKDACAICHTNVTADAAPGMTVFPNYTKPAAMLFDFSHKLHLSPRLRVVKFFGGAVECKACHSLDSTGEKATFPTHVECGACHSMQGVKPRLAADSKNEDCLACHTSKEQNNPNYKGIRRFVADAGGAMIESVKLVQPADPHKFLPAVRDLKFSHAKHLTDNRNVGIKCETCHIGIADKTTLAGLAIPSMWDCTVCHESQRTRADYRISNCSVCHTQISAGRKPRNHTLTERPFDHTAAFRVRHAEAARAPGAKCAFCHEFTAAPSPAVAGFQRTEERLLPSGAGCDECHSVMRPKSHTVRWRDDLHGRMAELNRQNCSTCHQPDYCERCHNVPPRSHTPLRAFVNGGHRFRAQMNQRSCFVCHEYKVTCERCHSVPIR
jgi:hypothetical protein